MVFGVFVLLWFSVILGGFRVFLRGFGVLWVLRASGFDVFGFRVNGLGLDCRFGCEFGFLWFCFDCWLRVFVGWCLLICVRF